MQINIIGLGNVGKTLARMFVDKRLANIAGVYNRTRANGLSGLDFIGQGRLCESIEDLPKADLTFITTSDDIISSISQEYAHNINLDKGSIVVHCSGVLPANCMQELRVKGCYICSIHPMHSFIDPSISLGTYPGTYCAIEGDEQAIPIVADLFAKIGSKLIRVATDKKPLYHAAGVIAANYLLTVAEQALTCLHGAKVNADDALNLVTSLMHSAISNLAAKKSPAAALTGPIKRGDLQTINMHIDAFPNANLKDFYEFMLEKTKDIIV